MATFMLFTLTSLLLISSPPIMAMAMPTRFDYRDALQKSLIFFQAQRSGVLPSEQCVKWRSHSGLKDGFLQGVDLVGGYYDAGDHVKFGFPMAFTITILSWSVIEFDKEIAACDQTEPALDAIKWGTDYFMKAHAQPNILWGQVGEGDSDHYCWQRAEDMTTPRTAYKVDPEHPGSDIAGETAAAMAAASIVFRPYNATYSELLLSHAKQLFFFADTYRGRYHDSIMDARGYYPSVSGYGDELLWAATWLFKATNDRYFLEYVAQKFAPMEDIGWISREFSWDNKYAGSEVLLAKIQMEGSHEAYNAKLKQYQAKVELFLCSCLQKKNGDNVTMTPGGLLYFKQWSNMQYVSLSTFLLVVYAKYLSLMNACLTCPVGPIQPMEILKFAQSQVDYILGKNPKSMSYLIGYGENYPARVHHRGASIPSTSILASHVGCIEGKEKWFYRKERNPNIIIGALVGGPNEKDEFCDERINYKQNEPSIVGNAPLVGLFARLDSTSRYSGHQKTISHLDGTLQPFLAIRRTSQFFQANKDRTSLNKSRSSKKIK